MAVLYMSLERQMGMGGGDASGRRGGFALFPEHEQNQEKFLKFAWNMRSLTVTAG